VLDYNLSLYLIIGVYIYTPQNKTCFYAVQCCSYTVVAIHGTLHVEEGDVRSDRHNGLADDAKTNSTLHS